MPEKSYMTRLSHQVLRLFDIYHQPLTERAMSARAQENSPTRTHFTSIALVVATLYGCGGDLSDDSVSTLRKSINIQSTQNNFEDTNVKKINSATASPISAAQYVIAKDGHFYRGERRLRLWGINLSMVGIDDKIEIDNFVSRHTQLGHNAVRLWPLDTTFYGINGAGTRIPATAAIDDKSQLDHFDYIVAQLSNAGIYMHMTALQQIGFQTLKNHPDTEVQAWANAAPDSAIANKIKAFAPFVSGPYRSMLKEHYKNILSRNNPYTGRSYANEPLVSTWELFNESHFIECALNASCITAMPQIAIDALSKTWSEATEFNPSGNPLPSNFGSFLNSGSYPAFAAFVTTQFISVATELRDYARLIGGTNSGIAVQPIIFNTYSYATNAAAHYAYSRGDGLALSAYHSPFASSLSTGFGGTPWMPATMGGKNPSLIEAFRVSDKPLIIYETSFFRPYPFRSEWGPMFAAMGLRQDWDAIFLYQQGGPGLIYSNLGSNTDYGKKPIPDPVIGKDSYTYGLNNGGDPIIMASWAIGGKLFQDVSESPTPRVLWRIPVNDIYKSSKNGGYPSNYLGGISESRDKTTSTEFITKGTSDCLPCRFETSEPTSFKIKWDTQNKRIKIDTPNGVAISGFLSGNFGKLLDDVSLHVTSSDFGVAAVFREGTQPVGSTAYSAFLIGKGENTGRIFDKNKVDITKPYGAIYGSIERGTLPIMYSGPTGVFSFSQPRSVSDFDFSFEKIAFQTSTTTTALPASLGSFVRKIQ